MAVSKELLSSAIKNAQRLCAPNSGAQTNKPNSDLYENYDSQARAYEKALGFGIDDDDMEDIAPRKNTRALNYNQSTAANSSVPDKIKKSMLEHKIDVGNTHDSVLDTLNIPARKKQVQVAPAQMLGEEARPQVIPSAGVDYSIIKAIVNECLNEYFTRKQPLNEVATLDTIGIKDGIITLIDNKGQAFAAKLKKIEKNED